MPERPKLSKLDKILYRILLAIVLLPILFLAGVLFIKIIPLKDAATSCTEKAKENVSLFMNNPIERLLAFQLGRVIVTGQDTEGTVYLTAYTSFGIPASKFETSCSAKGENGIGRIWP